MSDFNDILYKNLVILMIYLTFIVSLYSAAIEFLPARTERDTYDEREKLVSTYQIISKSQCLLQMRSFDGYIHAKPIMNLHDKHETIDGIFLFLPIAVNRFLIQHKASQRYLCGRNNQLIGLTEENERECLFEGKRSGYWDSYRLFYQNFNQGYLSISYQCHARLRRKYFNDKHLSFLAFLRINTDLPITHRNQTVGKSPHLINDYRQRLRKSYGYYRNRLKSLLYD